MHHTVLGIITALLDAIDLSNTLRLARVGSHQMLSLITRRNVLLGLLFILNANSEVMAQSYSETKSQWLRNDKLISDSQLDVRKRWSSSIASIDARAKQYIAGIRTSGCDDSEFEKYILVNVKGIEKVGRELKKLGRQIEELGTSRINDEDIQAAIRRNRKFYSDYWAHLTNTQRHLSEARLAFADVALSRGCIDVADIHYRLLLRSQDSGIVTRAMVGVQDVRQLRGSRSRP